MQQLWSLSKPHKIILYQDSCCTSAEVWLLQAADVFRQQTSGVLLRLWELFVNAVFLFNITRTDYLHLLRHNGEKVADLFIS